MSLSVPEPPAAAPPRRRTLRLGRVTPVTDRQREVLRYVVEHAETEGYPPSVREVCARFGWRSTRTAAAHLEELERKGALVVRPGVARGIRVLDPFA